MANRRSSTLARSSTIRAERKSRSNGQSSGTNTELGNETGRTDETSNARSDESAGSGYDERPTKTEPPAHDFLNEEQTTTRRRRTSTRLTAKKKEELTAKEISVAACGIACSAVYLCGSLALCGNTSLKLNDDETEAHGIALEQLISSYPNSKAAAAVVHSAPWLNFAGVVSGSIMIRFYMIKQYQEAKQKAQQQAQEEADGRTDTSRTVESPEPLEYA